MRTERLARDVIVFRAVGHIETEFIDLFSKVVSEAIADGKPHLFWDGEEMTSYDSEFRQKIGAYCLEVKGSVSAMNVYTPSRLVAMGASVINIWLGGFFTMFSAREPFDKALTQARFGRR